MTTMEDKNGKPASLNTTHHHETKAHGFMVKDKLGIWHDGGLNFSERVSDETLFAIMSDPEFYLRKNSLPDSSYVRYVNTVITISTILEE